VAWPFHEEKKQKNSNPNLIEFGVFSSAMATVRAPWIRRPSTGPSRVFFAFTMSRSRANAPPQRPREGLKIVPYLFSSVKLNAGKRDP
jgi:hypothetical protein